MQSRYILLVAVATLVSTQETSGATLSMPSSSPLNEHESIRINHRFLRTHTEDHAVEEEERAPWDFKKFSANLADLGKLKLPDLAKLKQSLPDWDKIAGYGKATGTAAKLASAKSFDERLAIINGVKDIDEMNALFLMTKPLLKNVLPDYDDTTSLEALLRMIKSSDLDDDMKALAWIAFQRYEGSLKAGTSKLDVSP
ncbi:hypothetical protein PInf_028080 [Phytophthora infestans]|nr:hypothetical protein PInf_028080 [Phytophthora infestans]